MDESSPHEATGICYARTYVHKALLSIAFLPVMLVVVQIGLSRGGATFLDLPYLIYSGQLVWWKQAIGWSCWVIWILRYCPPSWKALRHGMCAIAREGDDLVLSGVTRLPISEVVSIEPVSNITKKGIVLQTSDGRPHYACSILTDLNNPKMLAERILADCNLAGNDEAG
jgi:hypothetical protein